MTASSLLLVEPAFQSQPVSRGTLGPEVAEICEMAGFPPDPEQQLALDAMFAFGPDGKVAAFEFAVVCSRQNMKTGLFKQAALGWLFVTEQELIVWSAHEMKTTKEAFRDLENLITGCPALKGRLADGPSEGIFRGNGEEMIELAPTPSTPRGQRIMFKARTNGGGRGLTGDKVILDEAFALKPSHMGSLLPTLSARPDPQVVYGSSAGLAESEVLRGIRDRGRPGRGRLAYFEWSTPRGGCTVPDCDHALGTEGCALDDRDNWRRANPAMGRRITEDYIAAEREALGKIPEEFARERLGWWDDPAELDAALDFARWRQLEDPNSVATSVTAFVVEIDPDRAWSDIGMAGPRVDGRMHLEVFDHARGTSWLVPRCVGLAEVHPDAVFAVDGGSPAADQIAALEAAGLRVLVLSSADVAAATAGIVDAIREGTIAHGPQPELDAAVAAARKKFWRDGGFSLGRRASSSPIGPIQAVTLARFAALTSAPLNMTGIAFIETDDSDTASSNGPFIHDGSTGFFMLRKPREEQQ